MSDWSAAPQTTVVDRLTPVPPALRARIVSGGYGAERHGPWFDTLPCLRQIEQGGPAPRRESAPEAARLVFWNVERLRHLDAIAETLRGVRADVLLLSEIDRGMARSGNCDRVMDLAQDLGLGYVYGVEFVELGLGDLKEQVTHAGEANADGLHGAAVLSDIAMARPFLIRIDRRGDWFGQARFEPRVGGTIGLGVVVQVAGVPVVMVNVHLESHGDPAERAADMERLLAMVEEVAKGGPAVVGGDFNTSTASYAERKADPDAWRARLRAEPMRLLRPASFEPLFEVAAGRGYDWQGCNPPDQPTTRYPVGDPRPPAKIDWIFTRGLAVSEAAILPALRPDGTPSSDHELLAVTVRPLDPPR